MTRRISNALVQSSRLSVVVCTGIHGSFTEEYLGPAPDAKPHSYNISKAVSHDGIPVYA